MLVGQVPEVSAQFSRVTPRAALSQESGVAAGYMSQTSNQIVDSYREFCELGDFIGKCCSVLAINSSVT